MDSLLAAAPISAWPASIPVWAAQIKSAPPSRQERLELLDRAVEALRKGKKHTALALFAISLLCDQAKWLAAVQRDGLLRPTRQRIRRGACEYIVVSLLSEAAALGLHQETSTYLHSLGCLYRFDKNFEPAEVSLVKQVVSSKLTVLRSCLVLVDLWFFAREIGVAVDPNDPLSTRAEELADGFSFLRHLSVHHLPSTVTYLGITDAQGILDATYLAFLKAGADIRAYREWEIMVERFGYRCFEEHGRAVIDGPDITLEKSIRLGYIAVDQDKRNQAEEMRSDARPRLREIVDRFYDTWKLQGVEFVAQPYPRLRFHIPELPELWAAVREMPWLAEESAYLRTLATELGMPVEEVLAHVAFDGVTFHDLFLLQRFVNFWRHFINRELEHRFVTDRALVANSLVPVFSHDVLVRVLSMMIASAKVERILSVLTWREEDDTVLDIMYQPFVLAHGEYHVPLNILGSANIVRNTLQLKHRRVSHDTRTIDPVEESLAAVLSESFRHCRVHTTYDFAELAGDIDVLVISEGTLFVFECKGSLQPCNAFELRATYDSIKKAEHQLDRLSKQIKDRKFLEYLGSKVLFDLSEIRKTVFCIVVANPMFSGWRTGGYPVRSLRDLISFISSGSIHIANHPVRLRPEGRITGAILAEYIESDTVHSVVFDSMEPYEREVSIGKHRLSYKSFMLNVVTLGQRFGVEASSIKKWLTENERPVQPTRRNLFT